MADDVNKSWRSPGRIRAIIVGIIGFIAAVITILEYFESRHPPLPPAGTLAKLQQRKQLTVGYIPYYDMTSKNATDGRVTGFLVDVLHQLAADLSIPEDNIVFIETDWQNFGLGLKQGKYDLSIAGTFRTPARERIVSFTKPLGHLGNGALVRKGDNRFHRVEDLNRPDVKIAVVLGEQGYEYAQRFLPLAKPGLKIMPGPDLSLACLEVERGLADVALSDQYILKRYATEHKNVMDALEYSPYAVLPISWAVRKDDAQWLDYINARINYYEETGWLRRLRMEYSKIPWAPPSTQEPPPAVEQSLAKYVWAFITGIMYTIWISAASIILGTCIGIPLALMITQTTTKRWNVALQVIARAYIYLFLAVPPLVLIIILYYNNYIIAFSATVAAILALGINLSPFVAKIVIAGIQNVKSSYIDAARVFGYSERQIALKFKFYITAKSCLQPLLVQYFTTIKLSSLASIIGVTEVLHRSQQVIRETYQTTEAYLILILCYAAIVVPISIMADKYEADARPAVAS